MFDEIDGDLEPAGVEEPEALERVVVSRRELARERQREAARQARQDAYRRAKAKRDQDPRYLAMKEAAKLRRRELYQQAKARRKLAEESERAAKRSEEAARGVLKKRALPAQLEGKIAEAQQLSRLRLALEGALPGAVANDR